MQPKSILVVVDPTENSEQQCVVKGASLATMFGASLELLVCHYDQHLSGELFFDDPGLQLSREDAVKNRSSFLERIAAPLRNQGLKVKTTALWDTPLDEAIMRYAASTDCDLIVKDTHYHSAISRAFFSNTDWELIRSCHVPLLLSKPTPWRDNPDIIAAVDPMHSHDKPALLDGEILKAAELLCEKTSGELHVFHSYPVLTNRMAISPELLAESLNDVDKAIENEHETALNALLDRHAIKAATSHVLAGEPAKLLPEVAAALKASLVVMGAVSRKPVQRVFLGSTAEKVMDHLGCDLLIIKPDWFEGKVKPKDVELVTTVDPD